MSKAPNPEDTGQNPANPRQRSLRLVLGAGLFFFLGVVVGWAFHAALVTDARLSSGSPGTSSLDQQIVVLRKRIAESERDLELGHDAAPTRILLGDTYFDLGSALAVSGDSSAAMAAFERAIVHYEKARSAGAASADVLTDLGTMYFRVGRPREAIEAYERAIAADPAHLNAWMNLGVVRKEAFGDTAGTRQAWERVLAIDGSGPEAARVRSWLGSTRGE